MEGFVPAYLRLTRAQIQAKVAAATEELSSSIDPSFYS